MKSRKLEPFGLSLEGSLETLRPVGGNAVSNHLRELILKNGLVVLRNHGIDDLVQFASQLSAKKGPLEEQLLHWEFGPVMTMEYNPMAENYLFSDEPVPFHWDGAFHREPLFILFYCEESHGEGGETLFCDTSEIAESLCSNPTDIRLRFQTEKKGPLWWGIRDISLQEASHNRDPHSALRRLRAKSKEPSSKRGYRRHIGTGPRISQAVSGGRFTYSHTWQKGDLLIADNFSLIHGRRPLGQNIKRRFKRLQIL